MNNITIENLEMPTWDSWGAFKLKGLPNSHYRFNIDNGEPIVDNNVFIVDPDGDGSAGEQHDMSKTSSIYIDIQKALELHLKTNKNYDR